MKIRLLWMLLERDGAHSSWNRGEAFGDTFKGGEGADSGWAYVGQVLPVCSGGGCGELDFRVDPTLCSEDAPTPKP